jgi:hypothetical protein
LAAARRLGEGCCSIVRAALSRRLRGISASACRASLPLTSSGGGGVRVRGVALLGSSRGRLRESNVRRGTQTPCKRGMRAHKCTCTSASLQGAAAAGRLPPLPEWAKSWKCCWACNKGHAHWQWEVWKCGALAVRAELGRLPAQSSPLEWSATGRCKRTKGQRRAALKLRG